jgi:hypothetical protein
MRMRHGYWRRGALAPRLAGAVHRDSELKGSARRASLDPGLGGLSASSPGPAEAPPASWPSREARRRASLPAPAVSRWMCWRVQVAGWWLCSPGRAATRLASWRGLEESRSSAQAGRRWWAVRAAPGRARGRFRCRSGRWIGGKRLRCRDDQRDPPVHGSSGCRDARPCSTGSGHGQPRSASRPRG